MRQITLAVFIAALITGPAMSDTPISNAAPWDQAFLPPAPKWDGASRALLRPASDPWASGFEQDAELNFSPDYANTRAWFERLDAASDLIRLESFGTSPEGRDIYAVIASKDGAQFDPAKPVVLVQAGIHPGEIDGKDAGMMLLRDIAFYGKSDLLDGANLILIPILSVDGHERSGRYSRPNQRGPRVQGWRNTGTNQNLNRDYLKLDQPEMRAVRGLILKYNPDIYLDVHVTDGMDYQYDVTFGFTGEDETFTRSPAIAGWLDSVYKPHLYNGLEAQGHIPGELVFGLDDDNPRAGLNDGGLGERFSNGWGDAAHIPTILIENHSLKPHDQRVLGTYVFIEETLKVMSQNVAVVRAAIAADRALRPASLPANFVQVEEPTEIVPFKGIKYEMYESAASGRKEIRWLGEADPEIWQMPWFGSKPSLHLTRPSAYWVPAYRTDIIERLAASGVQMTRVDAPTSVDVTMLRLKGPKLSQRANEGHIEVKIDGVEEEMTRWTFAPGSVRVSTDQPLGDLVMLALEPQSRESYFAWGMFLEVLSRVEYIEPYAIAPLADLMMASDPALKAEFEAKLAAEPDFAANAHARLGWFYERTPFYDQRHLLYPVAREN
ncbi:M14 family metallopeptidase [Brevundimonas terrae]|uniref:M14 family metallopeptidase n=1 Tax=Brevundimonas terrae TaxID=363631 RepID=A0ABP3IE74_9CAUL|nr:murein tripeptide amidase MpaA [Brevundimonas terrae]